MTFRFVLSQFFFSVSPHSRRPKIPYNKLDDDEKKNNTTPNEESLLFFISTPQSTNQKIQSRDESKKNICLSSSFFSDLSLSFSRRRQK